MEDIKQEDIKQEQSDDEVPLKTRYLPTLVSHLWE